MEFDYNIISLILIVLFGAVTFAYRFYKQKQKNTNVDNTELVLQTLQPVILEILNDIVKYDYKVKDKASFFEYWIQYVYTKLQNTDGINDDLITIDNIKFVCEPILTQVWIMGRK